MPTAWRMVAGEQPSREWLDKYEEAWTDELV